MHNRHLKGSRYCLALLLLISSMSPFHLNAEMFIVVNLTSNFEHLTLKQAKLLWLGKKRRISGTKVIIVDQSDGSEIQAEFYNKVLNKSPQQMKAYWAKLVFTGSSFPPRKLKNDAKLISWVVNHPESIGYIKASSFNNTVRVIARIN